MPIPARRDRASDFEFDASREHIVRTLPWGLVGLSTAELVVIFGRAITSRIDDVSRLSGV
jgi:hypothetical protein